jgi:hypothetical protein
VNTTIVGEPCWSMPAVRVLATRLLASLINVLAEIEKLHGIDFLAHRVLKVLIGNLAIAVLVEVREYLLELVFSDE